MTKENELIEVEIPLHQYSTMCGNKTYIKINPNQPAILNLWNKKLERLIDKVFTYPIDENQRKQMDIVIEEINKLKET